MYDDIAAPMANLHRQDHLHARGAKPVESVEPRRGAVRGETLRASVQRGREYVLLPRLGRSNESKHGRRDAFRNTALDEPSECLLADARLTPVLSSEEAEFA